MNIIRKIQRGYLKDYLLHCVNRIEKAAKVRKRWDVTPEIQSLLTKLLIIYSPILIDDQVIKRLEKIKVETQFESFKVLEDYCHEFINQTLPFIKVEDNRKPRVESVHKTQIYSRTLSITDFLEIDSALQLKQVLESLVVLSERLNDHVKDVPTARKTILLRVLKETILPVQFVIEQIYEVINSEEEAN